MTCTTNADPGSPGSAVYAIIRGPAELRTALDKAFRGVAVVTCPGNIQSPGPWRRNATLSRSAALVCGLRNGVPTMTTEADLLISRVDATARWPTSARKLYKWWSLHS